MMYLYTLRLLEDTFGNIIFLACLQKYNKPVRSYFPSPLLIIGTKKKHFTYKITLDYTEVHFI